MRCRKSAARFRNRTGCLGDYISRFLKTAEPANEDKKDFNAMLIMTG